jgi:hypothetical protein
MAKLRSRKWYAGDDRNAYIDVTPCNSHLNEVAEAVKQGVHEAGADLDFLVGPSGPAVTRESH